MKEYKTLEGFETINTLAEKTQMSKTRIYKLVERNVISPEFRLGIYLFFKSDVLETLLKWKQDHPKRKPKKEITIKWKSIIQGGKNE